MQLSMGCGWCIADQHKQCLPKTSGWPYGRVILCGCKKCWPDGHPETPKVEVVVPVTVAEDEDV